MICDSGKKLPFAGFATVHKGQVSSIGNSMTPGRCQVTAFPGQDQDLLESKASAVLGGALIFNVWNGIDQNEFAHGVRLALDPLFPQEPLRFPIGIPRGCGATELIARQQSEADFTHDPALTTLAARSRTMSPDITAAAHCQGTPLRHEIETHGTSILLDAVHVAAAAIVALFSHGVVSGRL